MLGALAVVSSSRAVSSRAALMASTGCDGAVSRTRVPGELLCRQGLPAWQPTSDVKAFSGLLSNDARLEWIRMANVVPQIARKGRQRLSRRRQACLPTGPASPPPRPAAARQKASSVDPDISKYLKCDLIPSQNHSERLVVNRSAHSSVADMLLTSNERWQCRGAGRRLCRHLPSLLVSCLSAASHLHVNWHTIFKNIGICFNNNCTHQL